MRTLKKVLALTVVLATVFSLTAFAAFTDADQINESCQDDINLMNALNVMVGDAEGTFRPNGTISRAEAAKMVYVVRNGGVDDKASGWTGMSVFTDVPAGAWYEGYVNYCASLGIIAGVGGNRFNPDGAVTGVELAKMLLVVAGYKPEIEGYTGANWSLNVIDDAQQANMFEGYAIAFSASAPRQWAAKLFSNAILKTQMALYLGGERVNGAAFMADAELVGEKYFSLEIATGILMQIPHVNIDYKGEGGRANAGKSVLDNSNTTIINKLSTDPTQVNAEFVFNAPAELLGQEVNVVYKETEPGTNAYLGVKDTVYSVYTTGSSKVYDTTMDAITLAVNNAEAASRDDASVTIKFDGYNGGKAKVLADAGLEVVTNLYNIDTVKLSADKTDGKYTVDNKALVSAKSTAPVRLVDINNDGVLDFAYVTAPIYGTVRSYNADRFDFSTKAQFDGKAISSNRKEDDFKSFTFASNIAVNDVIRIDIDVTSGEVLYTVTKLEPTVASLTHVYEKDGKIKVGGTDYSFFGGDFNGEAVVLAAANYKDMLGKELTLYADGSYIFEATEGAATTLGTNFAFVQGISEDVPSTNGMSKVTKVQLVFADGTTGIYDYAEKSDAKYFNATAIKAKSEGVYKFLGTIVEYDISGSNVTFYSTPSVTPDSDNGIVYKGAAGQCTYASSTGTFGNVKVSDNTVLFAPAKDNGAIQYTDSNKNVIKKVTVVKGNELKGSPKINPAGTNATDKGMDYIAAKQNGILTLAYGILTDSNMSVSGTYAYTVDNSFKMTEEGKDTYRVKAILSDAADAEPVELVVTNTEALTANKVYAVTNNGNGTYTLAEILASNFGTKQVLNDVAGVSGNAVSIHGTLYYTTKDTKVFVVDMATGDITLGEVSDITTADKPEVGEAYKNIFAEYNNSDKTLTTVYVELYGNSVEKLLKYGNGVKAVYESSVVAAAAAITPATNKITVGGVDVNTKTNNTIDKVLSDLQNGTLNTPWTITKSADGKDIEFEAKTAGALGSTGAPTSAQAANLTQVTEGKDEIAAKGTTTVAAADEANASFAGLTSINLTTTTSGVGSDFSWAATKESDGSYTITITSTATDPTANATVGGVSLTGGAAAVKAKYKLAGVAAKITESTTASGSLTVCDMPYAVKTADDVAAQLGEWAAAYNADEGNDKWVASVNAAGNKIVFTAKTAGALSTTGATPPTGATKVTEGEDAQ